MLRTCATAARRMMSTAAKPAPKESVAALAARVSLRDRVVLVRADLNVPMKKGVEPATIADDTRIREALPTIRLLTDAGARVVLCSHMGRPKGKPQPQLSLAPIAADLSKKLGTSVASVGEFVGPSIAGAVPAAGGVLLLENLRFDPREEKNDAEFAAQLATSCGASVYVNDAFGCAHRAHASTAGVASAPGIEHSVCGLLLQKELDYLEGAVASPKRPFAAIVGGAKVSTKITVIESLMEKADKIVIGGGMVFTFLKARGLEVGASLVEEDQLELATKLEQLAVQKGVTFVLPTDVVVADKFAADAAHKVVPVEAIPQGWLGLDNGPESTKLIQRELSDCKTIIWNGPMGVFEFEPFAAGTFGICDTLAELTGKGATTIIGGGDSVAAVGKAGLAEKMSHISTGGGASLELLEGKVLPGVAALDDAK